METPALDRIAPGGFLYSLLMAKTAIPASAGIVVWVDGTGTQPNAGQGIGEQLAGGLEFPRSGCPGLRHGLRCQQDDRPSTLDL